ncbi:FUSC family protein [Geobacter luticola]|uniref:FUSC family protein n=2 Tax=Geomobilimonas luticola TaxID=1114878 RepID=A0ABS5SCV1_9BACT|nr:FUSC family protein [Geomobilimonas luticola]
MAQNLRGLLCRERPRIVLALRGTAAALVALTVAVLLKLECPFWAAMTAIIVIQPTRGLLLEKSFYRLVGTVVGSGAGILLLLYATSPVTLTIALSLWIAGCVVIGNLSYGLRSYSCLLAGYTCSVIAILGYQDPPNLHDLAFGRIAGTFIGIIVATTSTLLFTPRQSKGEFVERLQRAVGETVAWLALALRQGRGSRSVRQERDILMEIADIESLVDIVGAGSFRFKKRKRHVRSLIASLLALLAVGRLASERFARHGGEQCPDDYWREQLSLHLERIAGGLEGSGPAITCADELQTVAIEATARLPFLGETLDELVASLKLVLADYGAVTAAPETKPESRLVGHRDWREARRAGMRAATAILAVGLVWHVTGWKQALPLVMVTSIMVSLFSTREHPSATLAQVFIGASTGTMAGLFCRLVVLKGVVDPGIEIAVIAPFILLGVLLMQYRKTVAAATDATLIFMFVEQPGASLLPEPFLQLQGALATVVGIGFAWASFRYLLPVNPASRLRSLLAAIVRDLEAMASADSAAVIERLQARLQHRVIRLVVMARKFDADHQGIVEGGLTTLAIGRCILRLQEARTRKDIPPATARIIHQALRTLADPSQRPKNAEAVLRGASRALHGVPEPDGGEHGAPGRCAAEAMGDAAALFHGNVILMRGQRTQCPT